MKLTVFAAGSRGDIQPCLALCQGLQAAGHTVHLAAPVDFAAFAAEHGVAFRGLRGDVQAIMAGDTGRDFMETGGGNPLKSIRAMRTMLAPVVRQMIDDVLVACADAEAMICLGVFTAFGRSIADSLKIPIVAIEPTPLLPTRAFPAPSWPIQRSLGGLHALLSGRAMVGVLWLWYAPFVNDLRRRLGLRRMSGSGFLRTLRETPLLGAYSSHVIPRPPDWPESHVVTGYLFLPPQAGWEPPADLSAFLDVGDPPVCIGFGSMAGRDPEGLARLVVRALQDSGRRGVLLTGWGGLASGVDSAQVAVAAAVPHRWLFPRAAAVVHHGGAGTTAEGLRAGKPTVIVPFVLDQPWWGARVRALGVGPAPLPRQHLTAEHLARAIVTATTDHRIGARAEATGAAIRAEDGVATAVAAIERLLG